MDTLRSIFLKPQTTLPTTAFQYLSDLHLEVGNQYSTYKITSSAPYLILAGDIGRLIDYSAYFGFLRRCVQDFKLVFLVLGNHEFYGTTYEAGIEAAERLEKEECLEGKVVLMNRRRWDVEGEEGGVTVLGCTLWSHIPDEDDKPLWCRMKVSDFSKIESWSPDTHNAAHLSDLSWLRREVAAIQAQNGTTTNIKRKILIVTHHAPLVKGTSKPEHQQIETQWSCAFATDLLKKGDWRDVKVWVFGHTHFSTELRKRGVRVVSNQRGYVLSREMMIGEGSEKMRKGVEDGFDMEKVVEV